VCTGAHGHDARGTSRRQRGAQPERQSEVPEVVGCELQLIAFRRVLQLRQGHDPGIVDEHVQRPVPVGNECGNRSQHREVEMNGADVWVAGGGGETRGRLRPGGQIADGQRHLGTGEGQRPRRLDADSGSCPGDDDAPARKATAGHHLLGRGPGPERCRDGCHRLSA
jgi:hypothetical protein